MQNYQLIINAVKEKNSETVNIKELPELKSKTHIKRMKMPNQKT